MCTIRFNGSDAQVTMARIFTRPPEATDNTRHCTQTRVTRSFAVFTKHFNKKTSQI